MNKYDLKSVLEENKKLKKSAMTLRKIQLDLMEENQKLKDRLHDLLKYDGFEEKEQDPWYKQPVTYGEKLSEL